jgi:hypothetical protein
VYSIISEIARHLDLNSLHHLSRTCRQFRANLLQHRRQLIPKTLRCVSDAPPPSLRIPGSDTEDEDTWVTRGPSGIRIPRLTSGKFGACARDMVGECRRCGTVVCRVSIPPPSQKATSANLPNSELHDKSPLQQRSKVPSSKTLPHMHKSTSILPHNHHPRLPSRQPQLHPITPPSLPQPLLV